jgi:glycosyltransferase involved in cell wall biosynthesis
MEISAKRSRGVLGGAELGGSCMGTAEGPMSGQRTDETRSRPDPRPSPVRSTTEDHNLPVDTLGVSHLFRGVTVTTRRPATVVAHNGAAIFGGAERWTVRMLSRLQARGHRVVLLCRDPEIRDRVRERGVPAEVARLGGHASLHHALRFAARLRELRPDGLLLSTFKKTWLGAMGARLAGVPRVVARIGLSTDLPGRRGVYRVAFGRWIDRVVVNADELRRPVLEGIPGAAARKVVTVYNGVEPAPASRPPGAVREELGIPLGAPVVGTVARLAVQKRHDVLLRVAARLPEEVHVLLAGDGSERAALEALAGDLGISKRVHFAGMRDDVGDVLGALDLFLITSATEGMSNAMLEALGAGVPVVSTPVSGASEALDALEDGRRPGRIVACGEEAFAREVETLLKDPEARRTMSGAALERARSRFSWEGRVDRWEALLTEDVNADVHEGPSDIDRI